MKELYKTFDDMRLSTAESSSAVNEKDDSKKLRSKSLHKLQNKVSLDEVKEEPQAPKKINRVVEDFVKEKIVENPSQNSDWES